MTDGCPTCALWAPLAQRLAHHAAELRALDQAITAPEAQGSSRPRIRALQDVDYLQQALQDLARLAHALSTLSPDTRLTNAERAQIAAGLKMASTKALLAPLDAATTVAPAPRPPGEPEFF